MDLKYEKNQKKQAKNEDLKQQSKTQEPLLISLQNVASYKKKAELNTDKKINLVYGLNGTGKTVLSNYLYGKNKKNSQKNQDQSDFQDCSDNFDKNAKILVYNAQFIEDNFITQDKIKGIFTLSSKNKQALENIKTAEENLKKLTKEKESLEDQIISLQGQFKEKKDYIFQQVWKIKQEYTGGDRLLDYCLDGLKKSQKLFEYLSKIQKPENKPQETIERLKQTLKEIKQGTEIQLIQKLTIKSDNTEKNSIFTEAIVGSKSSVVSQLIERLNNSDWVKQGIEYLPKEIPESIECPFCQKKTITKELAENIKNYFDRSYQKKLDQVSTLHTQYKQIMTTVKDFYSDNKENKVIKETPDRFEKFVSQLQKVLEQNLEKIKKKISNPNQSVDLQQSTDQLNALNQFIDEINQKIDRYNQRIKNSNQEKEKIKTKFWETMRYEYNNTIEQYKQEERDFKKNKRDLEVEQKDNQKKIKEQEKIIEENQKNTQNMETAVSKINNNLKDIGIQDFQIKKNPNDDYYFLDRKTSTGSSFKSFSEGEKTIISFLYFLELCKGKTDQSEISSQKIIVIDDPISSLSHIYIFNVAQFIKNRFFKDPQNNYQRLFVLTHSLYFFHELVKGDNKKEKNHTKLFRITKEHASYIVCMEEEEIKNDYESYWAFLKDYQRNHTNNPILPNIMRNILEHFFGFIDKASFKEALNKMDSNKYSAFIRYMNRESHSDRENISDTKEIDHSIFVEAFKDIFKQAGHKKHYDKMMGI